ncbi:MAG: flippase activity-associated protein Agl23 [Acidobacteriota bacterium]
MSTTSSKSNKQQANRTKAPAAGGRTPVPASAVAPEDVMSDRARFIAVVAILLIAAILRLYDLDLVPLHHDEGVNGNFLVRLVREGYYHYDPANYHGPTIYYFAAIVAWILKPFVGPTANLSTIGIRIVPALFGLATIGLIFTLRKNLGTIATLSAAFLLAVSPGAVYLSRYFIHETLFVFFTLGIVVALLKYFEHPHLAYLILAAGSAALLFASKETAMISVAVLLIALIAVNVYRAFWRSITGAGKKKKKEAAARGEQDIRTFFEKTGGSTGLTISIVIALAAFVVVYVLFYSSFFTNYPQGIYDSLKTFQIWTKTGQSAHQHPPSTYIWWLLQQESPLLVLGSMGAILVVLKPVKSFALFSALWAFGLIAAYSLIAYKTPWLALNFIVPLALMSGVTFEWLYEELGKWELSKRMRSAVLAGVLLIAIGPLAGLARIFDEVAYSASTDSFKGLASIDVHWKTFIPGYQTFDLNFLNYDNDNRYYVYVYAHTRRETLNLMDEIDKVAQRTHQGTETGITIVSPDYWPLPWYLRDYKRVGYHGHMTPSTESIIIANEDQAAEVQATFGDRYQKVQSGFNTAGSFSLRPGVDLLLYTRRELVP